MKIYIFSTGSELTAGRSIDTNSAWMANELSGLGFSTERIIILPDYPESIFQHLTDICQIDETSLILMTGGLGATEDDHTLAIACRLAQTESIEYQPALQRLQEISKARGLDYTKILGKTRRQIRIPQKAIVLPNSTGIAPGFWLELEKKTILACFPGVPAEMKQMFRDEFLPLFLQKTQKSDYQTLIRYIWTVGEAIFQSKFIEKNKDLMDGVEWGITARPGHVKATFRNQNSKKLLDIAQSIENTFRHITSEDVTQALPQLLTSKNLTIASAESCTGGLIGKILTDRPGSSAYYHGGVIAYHNEVKEKLLQVQETTLEQYGAVSEQTAAEMVAGVLEIFPVDYALSITGIAGPGGGSEEKKVGLVYIGLQKRNQSPQIFRYNLPLRREMFRDYVANLALYLLYQNIDTESNQ